MLVSPVLNDLLLSLTCGTDEFVVEVEAALKTSGRWSSRGSRHTFSGSSSIIRRARGSYDVECLLGDGIWLTQVGDLGLLRIPGLPDTVSMAIAGLSVGEVIAHPLLARDAYLILSSRACPDGACAAYFSAPREELRYSVRSAAETTPQCRLA